MNILFVTLDQFRGDSLGVAGHDVVKTPTLDRIAAEGIRLSKHYSQAAPCSPGRAALYTGTYQMNNRVVANGTPHPAHFDNVALAARRAGFDPTLFGYTDQGLDPCLAAGDDDPRLNYYDGILRGFSIGCYLPESQAPWVAWLRTLGYDVPAGWWDALINEPTRPAEHSLSAFLTDRYLSWLGHQEPGWFAHLSYLRPHSPYAAAGSFAQLYSPDDVAMPIPPVDEARRHPLHNLSLQFEQSASPTDPTRLRDMRAQYYGMISEVDSQLGRVVDAIKERGEWEDTLVIVTSDHGEQLGDHGLKEKLAFFPQSYHILGLWRDPRRGDAGRVVDRFSENVDLLPTLCDSLGLAIPAQVDGRSLLPLFANDTTAWRSAAHYEWDWRYFFINSSREPWPVDRTLSHQNLAVSLSDDIAYVHFGDGSFRCFDLAADPTWRTECTDDSRVLASAQELLGWRQEHLNRDLTDLLLTSRRLGRWPVAAR
jgi:arylsulfatase A-like enzyme